MRGSVQRSRSAATGAGVTRYHAGDAVYGYIPHLNPVVHGGSWAELVTVPENDFVFAQPAGVGAAEAGSAALGGITALAVVDALALSEGETVLVLGATGGVGSFVVQLAAFPFPGRLASPDDPGSARS